MPSGGYRNNLWCLLTFLDQNALQASLKFDLVQSFLLNHSFASIFDVAFDLNIVSTTTERMVRPLISWNQGLEWEILALIVISHLKCILEFLILLYFKMLLSNIQRVRCC